jgi:hypothetical protein
VSTPLCRIQDVIERNAAFWRSAPVDRPLLGAYVGSYTSPLVYRIADDGDYLKPSQVVAEAFFDAIEAQCERWDALDGDLFEPAGPLYSIPWLEACLGLPIQVQGESVWAHQILAEDEPLERLHIVYRWDWIETLERFMRDLVGRFGERYPIAVPFLRGPADVITAMIGTARACLELYDHPEQMGTLIQTCADTWREIARRVQHPIPRFHGGFVNNARPLWSPAACSYSSEDSTTFLSAATYRRFFLPADVQISRTFPYGFIHRHSVSQQNIAGLLEINPAWAIEVTMDPTGPTVAEMLPLFRQLQARQRPLIIFGLNTEGSVAELVGALSPAGLCLIVQADDHDEAERLIRAARCR